MMRMTMIDEVHEDEDETIDEDNEEEDNGRTTGREWES